MNVTWDVFETELAVGGRIDVFFYSDGACSLAHSAVCSVRGTTNAEECSNRGVCDRTTGMFRRPLHAPFSYDKLVLLGRCNCFTGFGSSDGPLPGVRSASSEHRQRLDQVWEALG